LRGGIDDQFRYSIFHKIEVPLNGGFAKRL